MLADELPNGRLIVADSLLELRLNPERLTAQIASFLDEAWATPNSEQAKAGPKSGAERAG
jgi:hypothetical protein